MLAERKTRVKWTLNPRGNLWSQDSNKFGQKMLEKMGWKAGKGLGAKEQGITEHIKVSYKSDNKCIGYKEHGDEWIQQQSQFEDFLSELSTSHYKDTSIEDGKGNDSLEQKSRQSKARVHYKKFTRGKDLSNYSKHDLACILGVKKTKEEINGKMNDGCDEPRVGHVDDSFGVTTINSGSMSDYFIKMKNKSNSQTEAFDEMSASNVEAERLDKQKKKKQKKLDRTYSEYEPDPNHQISEERSKESVDEVKKKKKKKKDKLNGSGHSDDDKLANEKSYKEKEFYNDENQCNSEEIFKLKDMSDEGKFGNSENIDNGESIMDTKKRKKKKSCNNEEELNNAERSTRGNGSLQISETEKDASRGHTEKKKNEENSTEEYKGSQESGELKEQVETTVNEDLNEVSGDVVKRKKKKSNNINEFVEGDIKQNQIDISNSLVEVSGEVSVDAEKRKKKKKCSNNINEFVERISKQDETVICSDLIDVSEEGKSSKITVQKKKQKIKCSSIDFSASGTSEEFDNPQASKELVNEDSKEIREESKNRKRKKKYSNKTNESIEETGKQDQTVISSDLMEVSEEEMSSNIAVQKKKHKKKRNSSDFLTTGNSKEFGNQVTEESKKRKKKKYDINDDEVVEQINTKEDESVPHNDVIQIVPVENESVEGFAEKKKRKKKSSSLNIISVECDSHEKNNIEKCGNAVVENEQELSCAKSTENSKKNKTKKKKDKDIDETEINNGNNKTEGSPLRHVNSNVESVESSENVDESNLITKKRKRKSCDVAQEQNLECNENLDCKTDFETQKRKKKKKSCDTNGEFIGSSEEPSSLNIMDTTVTELETSVRKKKKLDSCEVMKTEEVISQEGDKNCSDLNWSSTGNMTGTRMYTGNSEEVAESSISIKNMKSSSLRKLVKPSDIEFKGSNVHTIIGYGSR